MVCLPLKEANSFNIAWLNKLFLARKRDFGVADIAGVTELHDRIIDLTDPLTRAWTLDDPSSISWN